MRIALQIFGQYRSYKRNLEKNLTNIQPSILQNNEVEAFILTDKNKNSFYSKDNENEIVEILKKFNIKVIFIKLWEDSTNDIFETEEKLQLAYINACKNKKGFNVFTPNLWYRRYILNKMKNDYISENNLQPYDIHIFARLFDITISTNATNKHISDKVSKCKNENILLMSIDTIFIGNKAVIDTLFDFGALGLIYHEDIWKNEKFNQTFASFDFTLHKHKYTYCSEIQIFAYIFFNNLLYENIRVDLHKRKNPSEELHVKLCKHRFHCF
jgi:hypothetical protein